MKHNKEKIKNTIAFATIGLLAVVFFYISHVKPEPPEKVYQVNFFLQERFWPSVHATSSVKENNKVKVILVPHHLLAGNMIAKMFAMLPKENITQAIVVGPNHYEKGAANVQVTSATWNSVIGKVPGNSLFVYPEVEKGFMENEHSIAGLMPYIAEYLPRARSTGIILKNHTTDEELERLTEDIAKKWDDETVMIVSVDFSHYLPMKIAEQKDERTRRLLLDQKESAFYGLSNDFMDSPPSIALLMKVCRQLDTKGLIISDHSNSARFLDNPGLESTTSYFTGYCESN